MNTTDSTTNEQPEAQPVLTGRRRVAVTVSWFLLFWAFAFALLLPPLCHCPLPFVITGGLSLVPLVLGVGGHRIGAGIALAFSLVVGISEFIADRQDHHRAMKVRQRIEQQQQTSTPIPK